MHIINNDVRFGDRADEYDRGYEGKFLSKFYHTLLNYVQVIPGAKMLDVGCGTGEILKRMEERFEIQGYGIDIDDEMLRVAKEKCPMMEFKTSSSDKLPFQNQQFDCILVCMAYHHFDNKAGFAKEAYRVMREEGSLYVAELRLPKMIRITLNQILKNHHNTARFFTTEELAQQFIKYGFRYNGCIEKGRVQIVQLTR